MQVSLLLLVFALCLHSVGRVLDTHRGGARTNGSKGAGSARQVDDRREVEGMWTLFRVAWMNPCFSWPSFMCFFNGFQRKKDIERESIYTKTIGLVIWPRDCEHIHPHFILFHMFGDSPWVPGQVWRALSSSAGVFQQRWCGNLVCIYKPACCKSLFIYI